MVLGSVGVNVTLRLQLPPGATLPQLWVAEKSSSELVTLETLSVAFPVLVSESSAGEVGVPTVCGGKSTPALSKAIAALDTPAPERLLRSGLPTTLEVTTSSPL